MFNDRMFNDTILSISGSTINYKYNANINYSEIYFHNMMTLLIIALIIVYLVF